MVLCLHADTARMLRNAEITRLALETRKTGMHGLRPLKNGKSSPKNWRRHSSSPGSSGSVRPRVLHQNISLVRKSSARDEKSLTVQWTAIPLSGARDRWWTMRDEFASKGFLAVAVVGIVLLFSGVLAFAFS
jgi:hypothetical protein